MNRNTIRPLTLLVTTGAALVVALAPVSATASQDRGESQITGSMDGSTNCLLERVDRHYVRCDDLTGAGVRAALWVPQHR
jgi:hypothetical protein